MSSMGSMPEVKVAKEDSDAIIGLGWVAWFGLIQFYLMPFERCVCFVIYVPTHINSLQTPLYTRLRMRPLHPFACNPQRTKTQKINIRHKHRARLFRTINFLSDPIKDVIRHRDGHGNNGDAIASNPFVLISGCVRVEVNRERKTASNNSGTGFFFVGWDALCESCR